MKRFIAVFALFVLTMAPTSVYADDGGSYAAPAPDSSYRDDGGSYTRPITEDDGEVWA